MIKDTDTLRQIKIERELKNKKRVWFLRRYLGRDLMQWANLFLGLFIIIFTIGKDVWTIADLFMMVLCGINISLWIWGGFYNSQKDMIEDLLETSKKTLDLARRAIRGRILPTSNSDYYYEIG